MKITGWDIYWITRLDGLHYLAIGVMVVSCLVAVVVVGAWAVMDESGELDDELKITLRQMFRNMVFSIAIMALVWAFTPSTKQAAAMFVIPKIASSGIADELTGDAADLYRLGIRSVKEWLAGSEEKKGTGNEK